MRIIITFFLFAFCSVSKLWNIRESASWSWSRRFVTDALFVFCVFDAICILPVSIFFLSCHRVMVPKFSERTPSLFVLCFVEFLFFNTFYFCAYTRDNKKDFEVLL